MLLKTYVHQACINLLSVKLRSFLAVLGILVGTAAVVALISCSKLATEKALEQFKNLGTNLLAVSVFADANSSGANDSISLEEWRRIKQLVPEVTAVAPYSMSYQTVNYAGSSQNNAVIGADEVLAKVIHIYLKKGHFVSFVESYEHYAVIGAGLEQKLRALRFEDPLGKQIQIGSTLYTIIGILNPWKENGYFNEDINQAIIIPIGGMRLINKDIKVSNSILLLNSQENIEDTINAIKTVIHHQSPKLMVFIRSAKQIIASMENQGKIFTVLLGIIGSIALLVGGIGVMNVMLVSVSERRKEIGLRKAIGARNRDIHLLFLIESIILSCIGGVIGVVVGLSLTCIIAFFCGWHFKLFVLPPIAGFMVSVLTGIFFGFYPAKRAAALHPMVCLRA